MRPIYFLDVDKSSVCHLQRVTDCVWVCASEYWQRRVALFFHRLWLLESFVPVGIPSTIMTSSRASGILSRLAELESSQNKMMRDMQSSHEAERAELCARIEEANSRRRVAEQGDASHEAQPVLMELNMNEIDSAVRAAALAEEESSLALKEAREVAESARVASGLPSKAVVAADSTRGVHVDNSVGFGTDSEYIVKQVSVNLDDVERVINQSPLVEVCRAFGRPDAKYGNEVYCCVVPKRNVRVSEPMLMLYAQKYLSSALCPKRFFFLDSLPANVTRKYLADYKMEEGAVPNVAGAIEPPPPMS